MKKPSELFFKEIETLFEKEIEVLKIPINNESGNFRELLEQKLKDYLSFFNKEIVPLTKGKGITFNKINISEISPKIEGLNKGLLNTVDKYLEGKPYEASKIFNESLNQINYEQIRLEETTPENNLFFRARLKSEEQFDKKDLFHIPFEKRTKVSTTRYSIPGTPALYLGTNSYTCWEEFDRPNFKNLFFSVFENTEKLNIIQILRIGDLFKLIEKFDSNPTFTTFFILQFFIYFPISIACSIKVYDRKGNFKPEYIIPQMLLEYVARNENIDGIKFPSTKINYNSLKNVDAYNYVFPIKKNTTYGYCSTLKKNFKLSEPSSLELEELLDNPVSRQTQTGGGLQLHQTEFKISIIEGEERYYFNTSFGKIDTLLCRKNRKKL
ncbi:hypothetical protein [uncultured Kordia sp.]|uniref:hypothetical protein n=1 Tax=uncultured Kordia sp. TaxID=507699 RepID=UPI00260CD636|nr:hypothetical protein [uncultured Kordia sp.]